MLDIPTEKPTYHQQLVQCLTRGLSADDHKESVSLEDLTQTFQTAVLVEEKRMKNRF